MHMIFYGFSLHVSIYKESKKKLIIKFKGIHVNQCFIEEVSEKSLLQRDIWHFS